MKGEKILLNLLQNSNELVDRFHDLLFVPVQTILPFEKSQIAALVCIQEPRC